MTQTFVEAVCEVLRSQGFVIRNLRPNGTVGVCYTTKVAEDIHSWLDENYPGWTQLLSNKL